MAKKRPLAFQDEDGPGGQAEALALVDSFKKTPSLFIEKCLSVVPMEGGSVIPFKLNPGQRLVMDKLEEMLKKNTYIRLIVLKSRRQGISTLCEAIMYWLASCFENHNTLVLAHDKDTSIVLNRMAQGFYDTDKRHVWGTMPQLGELSKTSLRFGNPDRKTRHIDPGLNSSMFVETAEGHSVGRGFTLFGYHWAEVAYTKKQQVATGLNIACSRTPGTVGIWESTANGVGDAFERTWLKSVEGEGAFVPVFLPWNIDPNCALPLKENEKTSWRYRPGEREIKEKYGLSFEQLKFRRVTIDSPECHQPGVPPEEVFRQEYPLSWEEAFLKKGKSFFLASALKTLRESEKGEKEPLYRGHITCPLGHVQLAMIKESLKPSPIYPTIRKEPFGALQVWEEPDQNEDYVVAGDAAEGLQRGDSHTAIVFARKKPRVVAKYAGRAVDPDEFGIICAMLGWKYNTALVGIERNGPGVSANRALRDVHYPRAWYDRDTVNINEPIKSFMGWNTNAANRRPTLDRLEAAIRNAEFGEPSSNFYEEARTFILVESTNSTGATRAKPVASPGRHDDEIMATAIALQLHIHGGAIKGEVARVTKSDEVDIYRPKPLPEKKPKVSSVYDWSNYSNPKSAW